MYANVANSMLIALKLCCLKDKQTFWLHHQGSGEYDSPLFSLLVILNP